METQPGLIIRAQSGFYTVQTDQGALVCWLRGRLKKNRAEGDIAAVGDRVRVRPLPDGNGVIEAVEPRRSELVRMAPSPRGAYRQVILANPDQVVVVFACAHPEPRLGLLDRFLVVAEKQGIPALIVANKVDLTGRDKAKAIFGHYPALGYEVIYTSVVSGEGLAELRGRLEGKISALAGPSGVGKSSLLNALQPGLGLKVREIRRGTHKGRHTTVVREMFALSGGGFVADTPGIKAFALWDIQPEELDGYFPELRDLVAQCEFSDCSHVHEPGCAIRAAVASGRIHPQRYRSYVRMRNISSDLSEDSVNVVDTRQK
jgi:ribosome biogenesis GTPase